MLRLQKKQFLNSEWQALVATPSETLDLDKTARECGAQKRQPMIAEGSTLLRPALADGLGGLSLRSAACT